MKKRRGHYVWRKYLLPWTFEDDSIWCYREGKIFYTSPFAVSGPENLRYQAVSNWLFQDLWLLASPLVAHGVGSTDVDNRYVCWGERLPNACRPITLAEILKLYTEE